MPPPSRQLRLQVKYNVTTEFPHLGLHSASASGDVGLVQYALSHGQPVNAVLDGVLPLHAACAGGNVLVVTLLIDQGADVNAPRLPRRYSDRNRDTAAPIVGTSGSTPLHFAAANGHLLVVRTLLSRGATPDRADKHGLTPELIARQNGWIECADVLAEAASAATPSSAISQHRGPSCSVEHLEASLRKRLHFKRSVDHTLSSAGGSSDPEIVPPHPSPGRPDCESLPPDSRLADNSASLADQLLSTRRPSLPQALDESSVKLSFHSRSARPRSAGTGADSRKLQSKLSLLSLFKKSNVDGSSSSVASPSDSPAPSSSPSRSVPIPPSHVLSSNTPPVSPRNTPTPLSSSPRDTSHVQHKRHRLEASASLTNVRAYPLLPADLHTRARSPTSRVQPESRMRSLGIAPGGHHKDDNPGLHPTQDHSTANSQLPFSINDPPPTEDALAESRLRGDSVSSASTTATASTYPQSSSSDATWSVATPSTPQLPGSPRIRPALGEYEGDAEEIREIHPQRQHPPLDIDISAISSHAQAEELVRRTQESILNMEQYLEQNVKKDSETGRTPLSAKLAAYGESLAIERRLKEKATAQTPEQRADVGHSTGMSLLSATKPSHTSSKFGDLSHYH
ncbi:hypothetical protein HD554DRAFT_2015379 [Boletus coccyginus]|nr:hypothetical protein HD554DRAFT_2015379 [Boletus coccyginus]